MWSAVRRHVSPHIPEGWTSLYLVVGPSRSAISYSAVSL